MKHVRPIKRFVLLLDDQPEEVTSGGVIVKIHGSVNMDYLVVRVGTEEKVDFGQGDRVVISDPNLGRKIRLDGVQYRVVRVSDIIAVIENEREK